MPRFDGELAKLNDTYSGSLEDPTGTLTTALAEISQQPAVFVGSGGALAVAEFAAQLHRMHHGQAARSDTPLGLSSSARERGAAAVLFSARGRNPDIRLAARAALRSGYNPVILVSCRPSSQLPESLTRHVHVAVHTPCPRDGFLATSSVIAMATSIAAAIGCDLPRALRFAPPAPDAALRGRTIVLGGALQKAPIVDLEARLSETGLSAVQMADLRNFAHGRHVGLARGVDETSVVLFADAASSELAVHVGNLLPSTVDQRLLMSDQVFPASAIELFGRSMHLTATTGQSRGVDPARPGVADFGRDLYRMSPDRFLDLPQIGPVDRKLAAAALGPAHNRFVRQHLEDWIGTLGRTPISAMVLDFDGTCCATDRRFDGLDSRVGSKLADLTDQGLSVAFASGRGQSLIRDVRKCLPEDAWPTTWVGLYNGASIQRLSDEPSEVDSPDPFLEEAAERLSDAPDHLRIAVELRPHQVSVTSEVLRSGDALLPVVAPLIYHEPALDVSITASGHSVDLVRRGTSKRSVVEHLRKLSAATVLAIGDQGHRNGNDFELLASTPWSLSVDRISADLSRCWNLGVGAQRGPALLARYLDSLHRTRGVWRFRWRNSL